MLITERDATDRAPVAARGAEDPRIRRSWLIFAGAFVLLGLIAVFRLSAEPRPLQLGDRPPRRRRRLRRGPPPDRRPGPRGRPAGRGRELRPDPPGPVAVDLARRDRRRDRRGARRRRPGADHVVIVRRRPDARVLEATLVNARTGGSTSSTLFPIGDLEDPPHLDGGRAGREPVAIPIEVGRRRSLPVGRPRSPALAGVAGVGRSPRAARRRMPRRAGRDARRRDLAGDRAAARAPTAARRSSRPARPAPRPRPRSARRGPDRRPGTGRLRPPPHPRRAADDRRRDDRRAADLAPDRRRRGRPPPSACWSAPRSRPRPPCRGPTPTARRRRAPRPTA